jgi:hypothetical protein
MQGACFGGDLHRYHFRLPYAELMSITRKVKRALRGDAGPLAASLEASRRLAVALRRRRERAMLDKFRGHPSSTEPARARLTSAFSDFSATQLLTHFRERKNPRFFEGFDARSSERPGQIDAPVREYAREILSHRWSLLGLGKFDFGTEIDWLQDPVTGIHWSLPYYADVELVRGDGSDIRVLWELNRLGHLLTLGRAYATTGDEQLAEEFFTQVESWRKQNPVAMGPNWACAMEVALRAMNLIAAFHLFRNSRALDECRLAMLLALFNAHGDHIRRNLEYSYIATGNHYLSDVVGLLWLGIYFPELEAAPAWRAFGLREMLRELEKQVLSDGAHYESSTGYHRFVTELFLYSFILCRVNGIEIEEKYWRRLRSMLAYSRDYLRPDGRAPVIGDSDGGRALPLFERDPDDHAYLIELGAAVFRESGFKIRDNPPDELSWLLGSKGERTYSELQTAGFSAAASACFKEAGTVVLRHKSSYLLMIASGAGLRGRGAHAHNDALSIELSVNGVSFLSDPGTFAYTSDLSARHLLRSTAYHSTVEVDGWEQNRISVDTPFIIGDGSRPCILKWQSDDRCDLVVAEHYGYKLLPNGPITHRRTIQFNKLERWWLIEDSLLGAGVHDFRFCFHVAPERKARVLDAFVVEINDELSGDRLLIAPVNSHSTVSLEPRWFSRHYGAKVESVAACWAINAAAPLKASWMLTSIHANEDVGRRRELVVNRISELGLVS